MTQNKQIKFLAFSDIHGNVSGVEILVQRVKNREYTGILFAGDFQAGVIEDLENSNEEYLKIMDLLFTFDIPVYYVLGNRDLVANSHGVKCIEADQHFHLKKDERIKVARNVFLSTDKTLVNEKTIYLTHIPNTIVKKALLQISGHVHWGVYYKNYLNLGFLYRDDAHDAQPLLGCYWELNIDQSNNVNVEWFSLGGMKKLVCTIHNYVDIYVPNNWRRCPFCEDKKNADLILEDLNEQEENEKSELELLPQVGFNRAKALQKLGINSLSDIEACDPTILLNLPGTSTWHVKLWKFSAKVLKQNKIHRISHPDWERVKIPVIVYDIETDNGGSHVWLIGLYNEKDDSFHQFWRKKDEKTVLSDFFAYLNNFPTVQLVSFSNSYFEKRVLKKVANCYNLSIPRNFDNEIDLGILVSSQTVGLTVYNLKNLGEKFGYSWKDSDIDGRLAGILYSHFLETGKEIDWDKLLEYNKDDVMITKRVLRTLLKFEEIQKTNICISNESLDSVLHTHTSNTHLKY